MGKILIVHVYEEEEDTKKLKEVNQRIRGNVLKEEETRISELCGTNEQEYNRMNGYM